MARASLQSSRYLLLYAAVFVVCIILLGTQLRALSASLQALRLADPHDLLLALAAVIAGYFAAAQSYVLLAAGRLRYWPTLAVQTASGFANRLLPAGLGGLGLYTIYLHRQGASLAVASAVVAANNILGAVGNGLLLAAVLAAQPQYISRLHAAGSANWSWLAVVIMVAGVLAVFVLVLGKSKRTPFAKRVAGFFKSLAVALRASLRPSTCTAGALACNMLLTSLNALVLCLCAWSVGAGLAWPEALIALSLGTAVGAAVPTPGGIGGVEAGLLAGLIVLGVPPALGLAALLLYRLITYWLPIIPGIAVFRLVERRYL